MCSHKTILISALIISALFLSSCSKLNCTRLEQYGGAEENLIKLSHRIADSLVQQAYPPLSPRNPYQPILITTLVDNNELEKTSTFGRIVQEHMTSRLVQLGYTVKEIKLRKDLVIQPQSGETMLTRQLDYIKPTQAAQAVSIGTISHTNRTMYINTRLVNPKTSTIISSQDHKLCMDDTVLAMFGLQKSTGSCDDCIEEPSRPFLNRYF